MLVMEASNVIVTNCEEDETTDLVNTRVLFTWNVYRTVAGNSNGEKAENADSIARKPSKFVLPPYTLVTNELYEVQLTVTMTSTMKAATSSILVYVTPSPIIANIEGGPERSIQLGYDLILDGSKSYDPDQRYINGLDAGLEYSWSCQQIAPHILNHCLLGLEVIDHMYFHLSANNLTAGTESIVTLQVKHETGSRTSQKHVRIRVVDILAPVLTVTADYNTPKFSAKNKLRLDGTIQDRKSVV